MAFVIALLGLFFLAFSCSPQIGVKQQETGKIANLLPDFLSGWKRVGPCWEANREEELYQRINGGASIFIKYGFRSYAGQIYQSQDGLEAEVNIYLLSEKQKARQLFYDQLIKPRLSKKVENLGEEARVDESALFYNIYEFLQGPFFIRITVQDKSKNSHQVAREFGQQILQKIKNLP